MYGRGHRQAEIRFGPPHTPDVVKTLMLVNVACFIVQQIAYAVHDLVRCDARAVLAGRRSGSPSPTCGCTAACSTSASTCSSLWMFGSPLAAAWGPKRFLRFYLLCGVGAGLLIVALPSIPLLWGGQPWPRASASRRSAPPARSSACCSPTRSPGPTARSCSSSRPSRSRRSGSSRSCSRWSSSRPGAANVSHVGHLGGALTGWILFRRENGLPILPSKDQLIYRWRRYKMRRQLHEVRREQQRNWRDDSRLH